MIESGELHMFKLDKNGGSLDIDCVPDDTHYGCTAFCSDPDPYPCAPGPNRPYPYSSDQPAISYQNDYLLDVVAQETGPNSFDELAVNAVAIAARSFAYHHIANEAPFDNSTSSYQYFGQFFGCYNAGNNPFGL
jgi:hypothetical protein